MVLAPFVVDVSLGNCAPALAHGFTPSPASSARRGRVRLLLFSWGHLLRKSACFSMCRGSAEWGHIPAKSFAISTNGLIQNDSGLSREPRNRPIPARLASTARVAKPRFAEPQAAFVRRCGGLIGETTL